MFEFFFKNNFWNNLAYSNDFLLFQILAGFGVRVDKLGQIFKDGKEPLDEYRGANFAVGGDPDVVSIPNILRKFSPKLVGDSKGTHIIEVCYGILCPSNYIPKLDQLNAAQSGAQALNVDKQG